MDFRPIVKVDKTRSSYLYKNYEISVDYVKDLGDFVEIEYKGKSSDKNAKAITEKMEEFLKSFKLGTIYRNYVGYPFQLLFSKKFKLEKL